MDSEVELHLRQLIFEKLADIVAENGVITRSELEQLQVGDQQWRVIDRNRGIQNPKELLARCR
jgi:putative restriction endonuclease